MVAASWTILSHAYVNKDDFAEDILRMGKQIDTDERRGESFRSSVKSAAPLDTDCANELLQTHHKLLSLEDDPVGDTDPPAYGVSKSMPSSKYIKGVNDTRSRIDIPYRAASKSLPKWYTETQEFIRRFEKEERPYPFFGNYLFYDSHIWLGLNNLRYILEMALNMGRILERTVVIPSKVYARSCTQFELCQVFGKMENLAEITDPFYARWALDIGTFWDVNEMRKTLNVMTSSEFNQVMMVKHGVIVEDPDEWIASQGGDLRLPRAISLLKVYHDLNQSISIDSQPLLPWLYDSDSAIVVVDDAAQLPNQGELPLKSQKQQQPEMEIYCIKDSFEMSVTETEKQTLPIRWEEHRDDNHAAKHGVMPVGFKQMYHSDATILHFQEGVHRFARFPFKFSTEEDRERYQHIALHEMAVSKTLQDARDFILRKLLTILENEPYIGFHYRQGDFQAYGWAKDEPVEVAAHKFIYGSWLYRDKSISPADCEVDFDSLPQDDANIRQVPWDKLKSCMNRRFYVASDLTNPEFVEAMRRVGGITIHDLVNDDEFIDRFLHMTVIGDYLG
ncbi:MAG: hypothetical protein BYD32DRAFT_439893 [Podila humilis]|nr:MAG: hypothetical protein BYD32DRAFT_439893 [Podila humilis]